MQGVLCSLSHGSPLFGAPRHNNAISQLKWYGVNVHSPTPWATGGCFCIMSMKSWCFAVPCDLVRHIVCLQLHVTLREGGHSALQKRVHNLVAPNAVAYIATSQKGMACTPRDPKCGRFCFIFLDLGQIPPPAFFGQPWPAKGGGREGGVNPPGQLRLGTPPHYSAMDVSSMCHLFLFSTENVDHISLIWRVGCSKHNCPKRMRQKCYYPMSVARDTASAQSWVAFSALVLESTHR